MPKKIQPKGHSKSRKIQGDHHQKVIAKICAKNIVKISNTRRQPITLEWIRQQAERSNVRFEEVLRILTQNGHKIGKVAGEK